MQVRGRWETSPSSIQYESNYEKRERYKRGDNPKDTYIFSNL